MGPLNNFKGSYESIKTVTEILQLWNLLSLHGWHAHEVDLDI